MSDLTDPLADEFGRIADEFVEAFRQGRRPTVEAFCRRYPGHADRIREVLPALVLMEKAKSSGADARGPVAGPAVATPLQQLGDFQILREVGRGGMGVVYEAQQLSLGRHVALKALPAQALLDPRQLGRFQREARAAARLHHTNIVPVFGVGEQDGLNYYVMQFIQGLGLDAVLVELRRLRQPSGRPPPRDEASPPPAGVDQGVTAVEVARALLSGEFPRPEPAGAATTANEAAAAAGDLEPPASVVPPDSSAAVHLPGQAEGSGLSDSGRRYWQSVARVGMQVADALAHAASQGILHRDIKPSNLLLDDRGNVWVTDFGLAKADSDVDDLTHTGDLVGTLRYMAPERFEGRGDVRSDVYSLGLTLYEMLTLRPAFEAPDRNRLVRQVMHEEPVRPRKLNAAVPPDLETVVLKAIARDPDHRYQTPAELASDLERFVEDRPIGARRVSESEKFRRWCRRNPLPAGLLAGVVLVFLAGFAGVSWQWRQAESARGDERIQRGQAELARDRARDQEAKALGEKARAERGEAAARAAEERTAVALYNSNIARAQLEYQAGNVAGSEAILARCPPDRRGWEWGFLDGLNHADLFTLTGHTSWVFAVAYSPDGKLIASGGGGDPYWRVHPRGAETPGEVILWDAATGDRLRTLTGHGHIIEGIAFSPDGKLLASASRDGTARLWDVTSGRAVRTLAAPAGFACVAFSPDGSLLATGGVDQLIRLWEVGSGQERRALRGSSGSLKSLAYSRDGGRLASTSDDGAVSRVILWDLATGRELPAPESNSTLGGGLSLSPDARGLAANDRSAIKVWDTTTGKLTRTLSGHLGIVHGLEYSPDGHMLASCGRDSTVRVWDVASGEESLLFRGHIGRVTAVAYSPDGSRLVSGGSDGTVKVWDTSLHPEYASLRVAWLTDHMSRFEALGFRADGRSLTLARQQPHRFLRVDPTEHTILGLGAVDLTEAWLTPAEPACLDAGGRWLAGVTRDAANVVKCWDTQTGAERVVLRGHTVPVRHVTISPGGDRLATGSQTLIPTQLDPERLGEVKVWNGDSGEPLFELAEPGLYVTRLALSPTGDRLALAGVRLATESGQETPVLRPFLTIYAVEGGRPLQTLTGVEDLWYGLAFSGDGRRLAACGGQEQTVLLWDLETGRQTVTRNGPMEAGDVAFSPDGRRLAVGGRRLEKLLDATTGEELLVLRGESQRIRDTGGHNPRVRWSPDGKQLAAVCGGSVSIWSAAEDTPEERDARRRAAVRRAEVDHLSMAHRFSIEDPIAARFHLDQVLDVEFVGAWEPAFRGMIHARLGQDDRADADYARASRLESGDPIIEYGYGESYAMVGRGDRAAPYFDRYTITGRGEFNTFYRIIAPTLDRGDRATYRRDAELLLERYGQSGDPLVIADILFWGLLLSDEGAPPEDLLRLADRCLDGTESHPNHSTMIMVKGMAEYRAGRYEAAVEWLEKAEPIAWSRTGIAFFLSMAYRRLDQTDRAEAAYQDALRHLAGRFGSADRFTPGRGEWWYWAWCQVVRREAEALLGREAEPVPLKD